MYVAASEGQLTHCLPFSSGGDCYKLRASTFWTLSQRNRLAYCFGNDKMGRGHSEGGGPRKGGVAGIDERKQIVPKEDKASNAYHHYWKTLHDHTRNSAWRKWLYPSLLQARKNICSVDTCKIL